MHASTVQPQGWAIIGMALFGCSIRLAKEVSEGNKTFNFLSKGGAGLYKTVIQKIAT